MEMILTILPGWPVSTKCLTRPCMVRNGARALVLKCRSHNSRVVSSRVPRSVRAAELTRLLTVPKCLKEVSMSRWPSSALETSSGQNRQSVPVARTCTAAASPLSTFRPLITIPRAFSCPRRLATAKPRPCVPPVIKAVVARFLNNQPSPRPAELAADITRGLVIEAAEAEVFHLQEFLDAIMRPLATEPGLFNPAKRSNLVGDKASVNTNHSRFQPFSSSPDATDVATVEVTGETEFGVVGHLNGFFIGLKPEERSQGPESFFASDLHLRSDPSQHGWFEESLAKSMAISAQQNTGSPRNGVLNMLLNFLHCGLVN